MRWTLLLFKTLLLHRVSEQKRGPQRQQLPVHSHLCAYFQCSTQEPHITAHGLACTHSAEHGCWSDMRAGTVLVTFKSHTMSVPPYRIENQCSDVHIYLVQACLAGERPGRWIWLPPRLSGSSLAYAWDEPNEEHRLRVKARAPFVELAAVLERYPFTLLRWQLS